jgi:cation:H+ antiporter
MNTDILSQRIRILPHLFITLKKIFLQLAIRRYVLFALLIVAAAIALPYFADHLADQTGMNKSFIGTLLVAATTSLPELVVSIAAVRMGSVDIAAGNLLGRNIFNMLILAFDDLVYKKGSLFMNVNPDHALSGLVALLMTSVAGISILYSTPQKICFRNRCCYPYYFIHFPDDNIIQYWINFKS